MKNGWTSFRTLDNVNKKKDVSNMKESTMLRSWQADQSVENHNYDRMSLLSKNNKKDILKKADRSNSKIDNKYKTCISLINGEKPVIFKRRTKEKTNNLTFLKNNKYVEEDQSERIASLAYSNTSKMSLTNNINRFKDKHENARRMLKRLNSNKMANFFKTCSNQKAFAESNIIPPAVQMQSLTNNSNQKFLQTLDNRYQIQTPRDSVLFSNKDLRPKLDQDHEQILSQKLTDEANINKLHIKELKKKQSSLNEIIQDQIDKNPMFNIPKGLKRLGITGSYRNINELH